MSTRYVGQALLGVRPRVWTSGMSVAQGEVVSSSLDWEDYRRKAATGSGSTDPADDITNYNAWSYDRVISLPVSEIANGTAGAGTFANGAVKVNPGVIAIGVRTEILNISGRGVLRYLGFLKAATNGGTLEVFIDGRQVVNTSLSTTNTVAQLMAGAWAVSGSNPAYYAIPEAGHKFCRSLSVFFTPAGTATNAQTTIAYLVSEIS